MRRARCLEARPGKHRAECGFAAMRAQDLEADRIQPGPKQRRGLIARRAAKHREKGFLGELFGLGRIIEPAPEESKQRLFVAVEEQVECIGLAARERDHQLLVGPVVGRIGNAGIVWAAAHGVGNKILHLILCLRNWNDHG